MNDLKITYKNKPMDWQMDVLTMTLLVDRAGIYEFDPIGDKWIYKPKPNIKP